MKKLTLLVCMLCLPGVTLAQDLPNCALSGSKSVMFGGKPALRLSDVINCPPESYEILTSIMIEGQPMVRFKPVHIGKTRCAVVGDTTIMAEGKPVTPQGTAHCTN